jgi:hypothetical protein
MFNIFLLLNTAKIEKKLKGDQNLWNILFDILNGPFSRQFKAVFEPTGFLPLSQEFQPAGPVRSTKILPVPSVDELACFFYTVLQIYSLSFKYLSILYKKKTSVEQKP